MSTEPPRFRGFNSPNYTPIPDQFFDELMTELSEAELRVLLYLMRRTFGFKKRADAISLSQLVNGIAAYDKGTGMHRSSVLRGCKGLAEKGVITVAKVKSENGEYETNVYALRFADGVGAQSDYPDAPKRLPVGAQSDQQETEIQKTDSESEDLKTNGRRRAKSTPEFKIGMTLQERAAWIERRKRWRGEG